MYADPYLEGNYYMVFLWNHCKIGIGSHNFVGEDKRFSQAGQRIL